MTTCTLPAQTPTARRRIGFAVLVAVTAALPSALVRAEGATIFVNKHASGQNSGQSWQDAFVDLQSALNVCTFGDEIWVAQGKYHPSTEGDRAATFQLQSGVRLYGGFAGNEAVREDRDVGRNRSLLSGNIGNRGRRTDNTYRVLSGTELTDATILDGFTICDAFNDRSEEASRGGGLYIIRSNLLVVNCTIADNFGSGGGVWNEVGNPQFVDCTFLRNERSAVLNRLGNPAFVRCDFSENISSSGDGGAYNGARTYLAPVFRQCVFYRNTASAWGGAYYGSGDPLFDGCLFVGNSAGNSAGAIYLKDGTGRLLNCAFYDNYAWQVAGGLATGGPGRAPMLKNCLFWGNTSTGGTLQQKNVWLHGGTIDHSCVEGWDGNYGGVGNHGLDPQFVDFDGGDYRLTAGSPCIDAGDNEAVSEPFDLDGNPRILSDVVDMGAYESVCDDVTKLKTSCKGEPGAGKLVAKVRTTLPGGSTVMLRCDDGRSTPAAIKPTGRGKAKWNNQTGPVGVCPSGCPESCAGASCP